jgi:hypothetical protein
MKRKLGLAAFVVAFAMTTSAGATLILPGAETPLQTVLNNITVGGPSSVNVNTDQVAPDGRWMVTGSGNASATMIIEIAGYANINSFGVYNGSNFATLFTGPAVQGARASFFVYANGDIGILQQYSGIYTTYSGFLTGNDFGFFMNSAGNTWFSEEVRNSDQSDHMVAFQGKGDTVQLPSAFPGTWTSNEYVLAWEDLAIGPNGPSDKDYNDMVVMVESVKPVPEPGTMVLLGTGLIGLAGWGRKKFRK